MELGCSCQLPGMVRVSCSAYFVTRWSLVHLPAAISMARGILYPSAISSDTPVGRRAHLYHNSAARLSPRPLCHHRRRLNTRKHRPSPRSLRHRHCRRAGSARGHGHIGWFLELGICVKVQLSTRRPSSLAQRHRTCVFESVFGSRRGS